MGMIRSAPSLGFVTERMTSGPAWGSRPFLAAGLLRLQDNPEMMRNLLRDGPGERAELVLSLIQATGATGMTDDVERLAADGPVGQRVSAIRALRVLSPARARARILQAIGEPSTAAGACWRSSDIDLSVEADRLIRLVGHEDPGMRIVAIRLLGALPTDAAEQALVSRLSDPEDAVYAVRALSQLSTPGRIRAVMGAASPENATTRGFAIMSLGSMAVAEARPLLREALTSKHAEIRNAAASSLGFVGEPDDVQRLAALLPAAGETDKASSDEIHAACSTVIALGKIGGAASRAAILRCLEDHMSSDSLARAAIQAYWMAADAGDFEPLNRFANRSNLSNDIFLSIGRMGALPLMREVAGTTPPRRADAWEQFIESSQYQSGILLAGVPWVPAGHGELWRHLGMLRSHGDLRMRLCASIGLIAMGRTTRSEELETLRDLRVLQVNNRFAKLAMPLCEALARKYEPEALSAYIAEREVTEDITSVQAFAAWAREAGLVLEGLPHAFPGRLAAGRKLSVRSAMLRFEGTAVISGTRVRLLTDEEALAAWEPRLRAK
jgi:HEAT repeat protein